MGAAQPEVPRRSHHCATVRSGSQFSEPFLSSSTSSVAARVEVSAMVMGVLL